MHVPRDAHVTWPFQWFNAVTTPIHNHTEPEWLQHAAAVYTKTETLTKYMWCRVFLYRCDLQDMFVSMLLESLGPPEAKQRGAGNLASLCTWARHVYDTSARTSQSDADVSASQGFQSCVTGTSEAVSNVCRVFRTWNHRSSSKMRPRAV